MSRAVAEWIGKHDDVAIPAGVQERVCRNANDCCLICARKIGGKLRAEIDHIIPLILGGQHRETNLQLLCSECHALKTKRDVKIKAKVARIRKKNLGIAKPSTFACSKQSRWKKKIDGSVVLR